MCFITLLINSGFIYQIIILDTSKIASIFPFRLYRICLLWFHWRLSKEHWCFLLDWTTNKTNQFRMKPLYRLLHNYNSLSSLGRSFLQKYILNYIRRNNLIPCILIGYVLCSLELLIWRNNLMPCNKYANRIYVI